MKARKDQEGNVQEMERQLESSIKRALSLRSRIQNINVSIRVEEMRAAALHKQLTERLLVLVKTGK